MMITLFVIGVILLLVIFLNFDLARKPEPDEPETAPAKTPRAYLGSREVEVVEFGPEFVTVKYLGSDREIVARKDKVMVVP